MSQAEPFRLCWAENAPRLDDAFIEALENWRGSAENPKLVVIDVFQRIKPAGKPSQNAYENDYAALAPLQRWATDAGIAVVCLHHTRKGGADDPLEALSGSNGLSACADTTRVLDRTSNGVSLYVRGRDVEEKESALTFVGGSWIVIGEAADVHRSSERGSILSALKESSEPMSPGQIADVTGMKSGNIRKLLHAMVKSAEVQKTARGCYAAPKLDA